MEVVLDYAETARRAFDAPVDAEARAAIRVWGDVLERDGDPRGGMIAIEYAEFANEHVRARAYTTHLLEHGRALLGDARALFETAHAIELEVRAGAAYAAFVDLRKDEGRAAHLTALLAAPIGATLRRLHVRVNHLTDLAAATRVFEYGTVRYPELEQVAIATAPRARGGTRGAFFPSLPNAWAIATPGYRNPPSATEPRPSDDPAVDRAARVRIGRALTSTDHRLAALEHLRTLGVRARCFVDVLRDFLRPQDIDWRPYQPLVALALGDMGREARHALADLRRVTGRVDYYGEDMRSAAGVAAAKIAEAIATG